MGKEKHLLPGDKTRKRVIKTQVKNNPNYGKKPNERNIRELLDSGIIILDKPCGPTSHQVDSWVKKIFNIDKVGHGGTLDPNATGVLPMGIGNATKALQVLLYAGKEYVGVMKLHKDLKLEKILKVSQGFVGEISQIPPVRSAVKRVRRKRQIYYLEIMEVDGREVLFKVGCESGTYVRTLCVDIGKKLNTKAHLAELRRTRVGKLNEEESVFLQDVKDAFFFWKEEKNDEEIKKVVKPVEKIFEHMPKIVVRDSAVDAICHGANLAIPGVTEVDTDIKKGDKAIITTLKDEGVALVKTLMSTEEIVEKETGICADIERVFMKKGTYPSIWKKS